jgi:hypothetical protein
MSFLDRLFRKKGADLNKKIKRGETPGGVLGPGVKCIYTGQPADSVDHFIPLSSGLEIADTRINFVPCTRDYNNKKGDRWPTIEEAERYFRYWEGQLEEVRDALKIAKQITSAGHGFHRDGAPRTEPYRPHRRNRNRRRRR